MQATEQAKTIAEAQACGRPRCLCAKTARTGSGQTHCPLTEHHNNGDRKPSLSLSVKDDTALWFCHSGVDCTQEKLTAAMRDILNDGTQKAPEHPGSETEVPKKVVATYTYETYTGAKNPIDAHGGIAYQVQRFEPKGFRQRRPGNGRGEQRWIYNLDDVEPILYRWPELAVADPDEWVWVVEGEKDADRLASLGFVVTTNSGGAGQWPKGHAAKVLKNRLLAIIPDNDRPGRSHAKEVAATTKKTLRSSVIINLNGSKDVSEWLDAGHTADELRSLLSAAIALPALVNDSESSPDVDWVSTPAQSNPYAGAPLPVLLNEYRRHVKQYMALDDEGFVICALWAAHTLVLPAFDYTPYLRIQSPEKQSGKTRLLEILELLVNRPMPILIPTASIVFRTAPQEPTMLIDESDAIWTTGEDDNSSDLRAAINAGFKRGAVVWRSAGREKNFEPQPYKVFAPKALAGLGRLPDTIEDRSIMLLLKRRLPDEVIGTFRRRLVEEDFRLLREAMAACLAPQADRLRQMIQSNQIQIPDGLSDRAADICEPIFAIADLAGSFVGQTWGDVIRYSVVKYMKASKDQRDLSPAIQLLRDILIIWRAMPPGAQTIKTADLIAKLRAMNDRSWRSYGRDRHPIESVEIARLLKPYGITPNQYRDVEKTRGYFLANFEDAWKRYLGVSLLPKAGTSGISGTDALLRQFPGSAIIDKEKTDE